MARIRRLVDRSRPTIYHVMSRTALDGYPLGDLEKEKFLSLIQLYSKLYFVDVIGFCLMGNHFHLMVRMYPSDHYSDEVVLAKLNTHFKGKKVIGKYQLSFYRSKLSSLSEYIKEIKQGFTRIYNKENNRSGFFWGQRFKSVIIENSNALLNCLAYIDLNPVRAGIVKQPEDYRWCTLGYLLQSDNKEDLLSLEFGNNKLNNMTLMERLIAYREFVYEIGALVREKGKALDKEILEKQRLRGFNISSLERIKYRSRYFSHSAFLGSKSFVQYHYRNFKEHFNHQKSKSPIPIRGMDGLFSLRSLS